ncbi:GNAT family N-acetyltransferase [Gilvibacter sediminis]|uniref:GNAT family N-acetyltransferase n=1 Tax=Gilvibacter sediminis TaxID=379071 RepID=UPI002350D4B1|nr:GNAT family N-acetyltransferase [Gilvibacter sediminis]MDC7997533.1 GNAT family N-acetyltransferase [Gilvibacter sediminis]
MITYSLEPQLTGEEFQKLLNASTLAERRPKALETLKEMVKHADIILTARDGDKLVGVSRSISDFTYCTYLSDLAVDEAYQHQGIGKELIRLTKAQAPEAKLILLAAPAAREYYPKIGMTQFEYCFYQ